MKKHETYQRACNNKEVHGFEGPMKVSHGNYCFPQAQDFLRAVESQGVPVTNDLQDLNTGYATTALHRVESLFQADPFHRHGAEYWMKWINRDTGKTLLLPTFHPGTYFPSAY
jgi:alcohol oxidase